MAEGDIISALRSMVPGLKEEDVTDLKAIAAYADNPLVLGMMVALLIEERRKTNQLLEEILRELRKRDVKEEEIVALSDQDERILELVKERGMVTAADVKEALGYKGLNGASARLNNLHRMGYLKKVRRGKKVYFMLA